MRISNDVKSGLYKALKWRFEDGTSDFCLKVPNIPECKALRDYLWSVKEPAAQYQSTTRGVVAWHWRLGPEHRSLYVKGRSQ